jgi:transcriptional regulator with XRE-family HTH domain
MWSAVIYVVSQCIKIIRTNKRPVPVVKTDTSTDKLDRPLRQNVLCRSMQTEFNKKLQKLRKENGLTQEQLSEKLHISRTAVSKWESGRGFPNIEALKNISSIFSVPVDDLLSDKGLRRIEQKDSPGTKDIPQTLLFGLCDFSVLSFIFLPLYGENTGSYIKAVNLLHYTTAPYISISFYLMTILLCITGIVETIIQLSGSRKWQHKIRSFSLILHSVTILFFAATREPYATSLLFILLLIKIGFSFKKTVHTCSSA